MKAFESAPAARPEKKESENEVASRLADRLYAWREHYFTAVFQAAMAVATSMSGKAVLEKYADDDREAQAKIARGEFEPTLDIDIRYDELLELDPEATPERVRRFLATMPRGFVEGEVGSIGFKDQKFEIGKHYGEELHSHSEGAATAGGGEKGHKTEIIFWKGSKDSTSEALWGATALHEIGHANDWRMDHQLDDAGRDALKKAVYARVLAPDRFHSDYVEMISNPVQEEALEHKAVEYWAEITEAYLAGTEMPEADAKLVRDHIAMQDPAFDRDRALQVRKALLHEMSLQEVEAGFATLPDLVKDRHRDWLARHQDASEPLDAARQAEGRAELVAFLKSDLYDSELDLVLEYLEYCKARESVAAWSMSMREKPDDWTLLSVPPDIRSMRQLRDAALRVDEAARRMRTPNPEALLDRVEALFAKYDLALARYRGNDLLPGEMARLFPDLENDRFDLEIMRATSWSERPNLMNEGKE